MISPAADMIKSTVSPLKSNLDIRYGNTAIRAKKPPQNKFKWAETFAKYSAVSVPGLIPGIYPPLFWIFSATWSVLNVIDT